MGLKHNAIHAMLANPHLAPFEVIDRPCQLQDWTLIDHLIVIHRIKESDYIEDDSQASIVNMARTLARCYIEESGGSRCVVLVKDGTGAQKPAVREIRLSRTLEPHIEFCKRNLCSIEYTMLKLLADMGMKDKVFLVTGAKGDASDEGLLQETSVSNMVSFHHTYLEYQECQDDSVFANIFDDLEPSNCELSDIDPSHVDGSIDRPQGLEGVFVATFADPKTVQVSTLQEACMRCRSTEADTLLVELANVLEGSVTVCTGDSDVLGVLTACGREGVTMRMDNKSYYQDRDMHMSRFGELLFDIPENRTLTAPFSESDSSEDRFRVMCDVTAEDEWLLPATRKQHESFEVILDEYGKVNFKTNVASYLYLAGIRGSLYSTFLARFFDSNTRKILDELELAVDKNLINTNTVCYIFETICPASNENEKSQLLGSDSDNPPSTGEKRKYHYVSNLDLDLDLDLDDGAESNAVQSKEGKEAITRLKRLSNAYITGMVPRGSHGRFLRLNQAGRYIFMRLKGEVVRDKTVRMERLFFMMLCGTDYNRIPVGLGIKRLMTGAVTNYKSFSSWCQELEGIFSGVPGASYRNCNYYNMGMKLAWFTKVPRMTQSKYWTEVNCGVMIKTMKYVCELWNLKRPTPGPEYGFSVRDGVVHFEHEDVK